MCGDGMKFQVNTRIAESFMGWCPTTTISKSMSFQEVEAGTFARQHIAIPLAELGVATRDYTNTADC